MYCESEICYLRYSIFDKNICSFDVSMNDVFGVEIFETLVDVSDIRPSVFLA
jgi:hypothetical protein